MNKAAEPEPDWLSPEDRRILGNRIWDLRQYTYGQIDHMLQQAVRDKSSREEVVRRLEALLAEDAPWAEAHRRLEAVSIGDALRSLLLSREDDQHIRSFAAEKRRELLDDDHPLAAEFEAAIAKKLVDVFRSDTELAEVVRVLAPPPGPRKRRSASRDARPAPARSPSATSKNAVGEERRAVDAKIKQRKGAWRAHCGNPMPGGCRGELGRFEDTREVGQDAYADFPPEMRPAGRWVLRSDHGYGGNAEVGYTVLREPKKSRRPLPERFGNVGGRLDFAGYWHGFVGQLPQPPCLVVCPLCGVQNDVGQPPDG